MLSGGPCSVYDPGRAGLRSRRAVAGRSGSGHLLRPAVDRAHAGRAGASAPIAASTAPRSSTCAMARRFSPGLPRRLKIWMSHGDHVLALPPGFHVTGATGNSLSAAEDPARRIFAVQFHPEVQHTERGSEILRNFIFAHLRRAAQLERRFFHCRDGGSHSQAGRPASAPSARSAAAWIRRSRRRWCIAPSAIG